MIVMGGLFDVVCVVFWYIWCDGNDVVLFEGFVVLCEVVSFVEGVVVVE